MRVIVRAAQLWGEHDCVDLSAAFAYHTLQSFFPILLIALAMASQLLGQEADRVDEILAVLKSVLPPSVLGLVESTLRDLVRQGKGAGLFGLFFLSISATNAYLSLQRGADRLWSSALPRRSRQLPVRRHIRAFLAARLEAFAVVAVLGVLVVADQLLANLRRFSGASWLAETLRNQPWLADLALLAPGVSAFSSGLGYSLLMLLLMRLLPSRTVRWRPLVPGALFIGLSISILNSALTRSLLSLGTRFQAYGVVGGVLVLTLWVWILGLAVYFGQCLSVALALPRGPDQAAAEIPGVDARPAP
ncbi:YihY/virulence factor BrkB family protein [Synechococcus sp. RSCCF101]|uniref:YihY/virulence factor BrkB family protein n=1 Tax=Synechococcus sp. RSCCF101 TaxID=2511069 RepID=UPI0012477E73|nr:YihY/virulence factor BrkB family protein [Synechococcus sp. RSCCF101]QEY32936.1 YihY/virulence factor BrkB family protein [Synechococcus sp. RSCCF101]